MTDITRAEIEKNRQSVIDFLKTENDHDFDLNFWTLLKIPGTEEYFNKRGHKCNTLLCLGGTIEVVIETDDEYLDDVMVPKLEKLGLNSSTLFQDALFYPDLTEAEYNSKTARDAITTFERACRLCDNGEGNDENFENWNFWQ